MRDDDGASEMVPICRWCGVLVVWDAHVSGAWSHWNGPTYCRERGTTYTATPVTSAMPTYFKLPPQDPRAWAV